MTEQLTFGEQLKTIRESCQVSVRQLAKKLRVNPGYISKVERDIEPPPSEKTIKKIAKQFQQSQDELLALAGKVSTEILNTILDRPKQVCALLKLVGKLDTQDLEKLIYLGKDFQRRASIRRYWDGVGYKK